MHNIYLLNTLIVFLQHVSVLYEYIIWTFVLLLTSARYVAIDYGFHSS